MIIVKLTSGFGNQLFQYAFAYVLSKEHKQKLKIDALSYDKNYERPFDLNRLSITADILYRPNRKRIIRMAERAILMLPLKYVKEAKTYHYDSDFVTSLPKRCYLQGYWQSEKYFTKYKSDIVKEFAYRGQFSDFAKKRIEDYRSRNTVAVHIRRGDYIRVNGCISMDYYRDAIEIIRKKISDPEFVFFSDDIEWVIEEFTNLENSYFFKNDGVVDDIEEFFIMSACRNQIIANSSFSWWAAYLNHYDSKIVIAPEVSCWADDFYPDEFIRVKTSIVKG